ncbi:MAG: malonate decarboxylase holo-[acyl-carrier-protein] synthase [Burkholderiaceae bacterium]
MALPRHSLVTLNDAGWDEALSGLPLACAERAAPWRRAGWPLVARRADPTAAADKVSLGIPLPPDADGQKLRIPVTVPAAGIAVVAPPLTLESCVPAAPAGWRDTLAALAAACGAAGMPLRVFGSLAMQRLTGLRYLTDASDVDLLAAPATAAQLARILALLDDAARCARLDGEILFPDGRAVAWKEWRDARRAASGTRVLVKHDTGVALAAVASLMATLAAPCEAAC